MNREEFMEEKSWMKTDATLYVARAIANAKIKRIVMIGQITAAVREQIKREPINEVMLEEIVDVLMTIGMKLAIEHATTAEMN